MDKEKLKKVMKEDIKIIQTMIFFIVIVVIWVSVCFQFLYQKINSLWFFAIVYGVPIIVVFILVVYNDYKAEGYTIDFS